MSDQDSRLQSALDRIGPDATAHQLACAAEIELDEAQEYLRVQAESSTAENPPAA